MVEMLAERSPGGTGWSPREGVGGPCAETVAVSLESQRPSKRGACSLFKSQPLARNFTRQHRLNVGPSGIFRGGKIDIFCNAW